MARTYQRSTQIFGRRVQELMHVRLSRNTEQHKLVGFEREGAKLHIRDGVRRDEDRLGRNRSSEVDRPKLMYRGRKVNLAILRGVG
jgi:hypothetical protein